MKFALVTLSAILAIASGTPSSCTAPLAYTTGTRVTGDTTTDGEDGDPNFNLCSSSRAVWYSTTLSSGEWEISLNSTSGHDTVLDMWSSCSAEGFIQCNDDGGGGIGLNSRIYYESCGARQVLFRLGGFSGATGAYEFSATRIGPAFFCPTCDCPETNAAGDGTEGSTCFSCLNNEDVQDCIDDELNRRGYQVNNCELAAITHDCFDSEPTCVGAKTCQEEACVNSESCQTDNLEVDELGYNHSGCGGVATLQPTVQRCTRDSQEYHNCVCSDSRGRLVDPNPLSDPDIFYNISVCDPHIENFGGWVDFDTIELRRNLFGEECRVAEAESSCVIEHCRDQYDNDPEYRENCVSNHYGFQGDAIVLESSCTLECYSESNSATTATLAAALLLL